MNIRGITVSVNYADLLSVGLDRWDEGLDSILVVTSTKDKATQTLCAERRIPTHVTDIFYANGASFNKGAAISEAIIATNFRRGADWFLLFDSDIVPPSNWREVVDRHGCQPGKLYGAWRYENPENYTLEQCDPKKGPLIHQSWVIGFFALFHSQDPRVPPDPMLEVIWGHCGNYDTSFSWRWPHVGPNKMQEFINLRTVHLGQQRQNWLGRGKGQELHDLLRQRRHFHDVQREMVISPPMPEVK
jgi:hypothetical protein